jgi:hypothetical protein
MGDFDFVKPPKYSGWFDDVKPPADISAVNTEYKYARQKKTGNMVGNYISSVVGGGHCSWDAETLDRAVLFNTASEAEAETDQADVYHRGEFVVVPVRVTTTRVVTPGGTAPRVITLGATKLKYRVVDGEAEYESTTLNRWNTSSDYGRDRRFGHMVDSGLPAADIAAIIELYRNPNTTTPAKTETKVTRSLT